MRRLRRGPELKPGFLELAPPTLMGIPSAYAAQIETGTVNGRMTTDFPITVQGRIGRRLSLPMNGGGTPIRAMTTNGSVTLSRR